MSVLDDVIAKGIALNEAVQKMNQETNAILSVTEEKRAKRKEEMRNDLQKYIDAMAAMDIEKIKMKLPRVMYFNGSDKCIGIYIRRDTGRMKSPYKSSSEQIDLILFSNVMPETYAYHSLSYIASGARNDAILHYFSDNWSDIEPHIDGIFAKEVESILEKRKETAINERESAIKDLTNIAR